MRHSVVGACLFEATPLSRETKLPRFFFDIESDGDSLAVDSEGLDLPSLQRAKVEAIAALPSLAREVGGDQWVIHSRVRNEVGDLVFEATLRFETKHNA